MADHSRQVVGYLAILAKGKLMAAGEGCLVLGSKNAMRCHLHEAVPDLVANAKIRKTRFGDIMGALYRGGTYAFDQQSYDRFLPLAQAERLGVRSVDFEEMKRKGFDFVTVCLDEGELVTRQSR